MNNKNTLNKGARPLTLEEIEAVSGGFWGVVIGVVIAVATIVVESIKCNSDPDPLKGFGKNDD